MHIILSFQINAKCKLALDMDIHGYCAVAFAN